MSLLTNWGYTLADSDSMTDMLSELEFNEITSGKYSGDTRIMPNIRAACDAIRNYCGWHVYPLEHCELSTSMFDRRVARVGDSLLIQLPATYVTLVTSVRINDAECSTYYCQNNGLLKVYGVDWTGVKEYTPIEVEYSAGEPDAFMSGLKELIAHRVTHALASSSGVQSETAGGVSITYSANWINSARSTALPNDNKEVLAPFKVQEVL